MTNTNNSTHFLHVQFCAAATARKKAQAFFYSFSLLFFSSIIIFTPVHAQELSPSDSLYQVLVAREKEMFPIMINGDKAAADKVMGADYITINADGCMQDKAQTMKTIGKFKGSVSTLSDVDRKIRLYGNLAVITGRSKAHVKGILVADFLYTEIWILRAGQWQFIGWQGTMTGTPTWYPIIVAIILTLLVLLLLRFIVRRLRKRNVSRT